MAIDQKLFLAYLIGQYPAVSHTFILREVTQPRSLGRDIQTASVDSAEEGGRGLTDVESREVARTLYVKKRGILNVLLDHMSCAMCRPLGYARGIALTIRLGRIDLRAIVFHWFYFLEAVIVGQWMLRKKLTHVHVHFASATATVALIASKIFPIHYSITIHGSDEFFDVGRYRGEGLQCR
jgi:colanic acid/amylovoran biosynthesis glycosyltransferase